MGSKRSRARMEQLKQRLFAGMVTPSGDLVVLGVQRQGAELAAGQPLDAGDTLLTQMTTQEGADGWACQHALSLVSNVTVEAWACGYSITDEAAEMANAMVENAAK